jgi:hypothetical protein
VEGKNHPPFYRPDNFASDFYALFTFSSVQEYCQITIRAQGEFLLQTYNWRSLWQGRAFSFQHFSLYLAVNFGYMRGIGSMERRAKKSRKNAPQLVIPGKVLKIFSRKPGRSASRVFLGFNAAWPEAPARLP